MVQGWWRSTAAVVCALMMAGCASGGAQESGAQARVVVDDARVGVVDNDFEPERLEVPVGETVTWVWEGRANHDVVGEGFSSEVQRSGTFAHTFETEGEYPYRCTLHPGMEGLVAVVER